MGCHAAVGRFDTPRGLLHHRWKCALYLVAWPRCRPGSTFTPERRGRPCPRWRPALSAWSTFAAAIRCTARGSPPLFRLLQSVCPCEKKIDFVRFFYFFVKKTMFVDEKSTFIIIITFHQITHQLVLSIFTWDFIFSSKFSL